jgi:hypothetical protein
MAVVAAAVLVEVTMAVAMVAIAVVEDVITVVIPRPTLLLPVAVIRLLRPLLPQQFVATLK